MKELINQTRKAFDEETSFWRGQMQKQWEGFSEESGFRNIDKIKKFNKPTLIIHAEFDHIIPYSEGQSLFDASAAKDKKLLQIPGANHNDIFARGLSAYLTAIQNLVESLSA